MIGKYYRFIGLASVVIGILSSGCGTTHPNLQGEAGYTDSTEESNLELESRTVVQTDTLVFDPLALGDDGILVPRPQPAVSPGGQGAESEIELLQGDDESGGQLGGEVEEVWEEQMRPGYRVQIFASRQVGKAHEIEQQAGRQFPEGAYMVYDPPNYKIRVGDCLTRGEAEELRRKAVAIGYHDAWVVKDNIVVKVRAGR